MSGLTIPVAEILGRPGHYRDFRLVETLDGVATALARLDPPSIDARLRAESVMEGILVTGPAAGSAVFTCARCLKEFPATIEIDVVELFATPERIRDEEDSDAYPISGTEMDLEPMLRDVLTLALPLNPHCAEDCTGLCARCGRALVDGACDCSHEERDPRWAELDALKDRLA